MSLCNEQEARELWCPMVRIARREEWHEASGTAGNPSSQHETHIHTIVGGCNTDALGGNRVPASCRCIGSKCAMWRWGEPELTFADRRLGYCGLAGQAVHP